MFNLAIYFLLVCFYKKLNLNKKVMDIKLLTLFGSILDDLSR